MFRFNLILILTLVFLSSCSTTDNSSSANSEGTNASEILNNNNLKEDMSKTEEASITVLMVPDWCKKMPKSDLFIYACGIGNSSNLNMSNSRALLDGKAKLANQINGQITSRMTDLLEDLGENNNQVIQASERVIKSVTKETQVAGFKEVQSEFQNIGSKFQTYILLEYPIGEANQLLYNKIKNDSILSNQEAIDSALEELEAEINKKSSTN